MTRGFVGGAIAFLLTSMPSHAQTRPDFSGVWVLDPGSSPMCGRSFTAIQNATMLRLEFPDEPIAKRGNAPAATTTPLRRVQYNFDGTDTREILPAARPRPTDAPTTMWIATAVESIARAA